MHGCHIPGEAPSSTYEPARVYLLIDLQGRETFICHASVGYGPGIRGAFLPRRTLA